MRARSTWRGATLSVGFLVFFASAGRAQIQIQPRMGDPVPGLTASELQRFFTGQTEGFDHLFTNAEGLGPTMNDTACNGCHLQPASGGGSNKSVTRFGIAPSGPNPFDPLDGTGPSGLNLGGSLLQSISINSPSCDEVVPTIAGGFPVDADIVIQRVTPPAFAAGLVEAIDDADIQYWALNPPHPWIAGATHMVQPAEGPPGLRVGRFGWKAQEATVMSFSSGASLNELGITNDFNLSETAANGDLSKLAACDAVPEPEDVPDAFGFRRIDRMTDYQRFLAPAPQTPKSGMTGEGLFIAVGCADCHVSTPYTTMTTTFYGGPLEGALAGKTIKPYSDFLLHNVGTGDGIVQGGASGDVFRTSPLWGVRVRAPDGLLHDGRGYDAANPTADNNLKEAINNHTMEADPARLAFQGLLAADQQKVLDFLNSLGRVEFDWQGDHDVDAFDWFFLEPSFSGPGSFYTPDSPQAVADIDQDGDFDLVDFGYWQRANTN